MSSAAISGLIMLAPSRLPPIIALLLTVPASLAAIVMDQTHYHSLFKTLRIVGGNPRLHTAYSLGVSLLLAIIYLPPYLLAAILSNFTVDAYLLVASPISMLVTYLMLRIIEHTVKHGWRVTFP